MNFLSTKNFIVILFFINVLACKNQNSKNIVTPKVFDAIAVSDSCAAYLTNNLGLFEARPYLSSDQLDQKRSLGIERESFENKISLPTIEPLTLDNYDYVVWEACQVDEKKPICRKGIFGIVGDYLDFPVGKLSVDIYACIDKERASTEAQSCFSAKKSGNLADNLIGCGLCGSPHREYFVQLDNSGVSRTEFEKNIDELRQISSQTLPQLVEKIFDACKVYISAYEKYDSVTKNNEITHYLACKNIKDGYSVNILQDLMTVHQDEIEQSLEEMIQNKVEEKDVDAAHSLELVSDSPCGNVLQNSKVKEIVQNTSEKFKSSVNYTDSKEDLGAEELAKKDAGVVLGDDPNYGAETPTMIAGGDAPKILAWGISFAVVGSLGIAIGIAQNYTKYVPHLDLLLGPVSAEKRYKKAWLGMKNASSIEEFEFYARRAKEVWSGPDGVFNRLKRIFSLRGIQGLDYGLARGLDGESPGTKAMRENLDAIIKKIEDLKIRGDYSAGRSAIFSQFKESDETKKIINALDFKRENFRTIGKTKIALGVLAVAVGGLLIGATQLSLAEDSPKAVLLDELNQLYPRIKKVLARRAFLEESFYKNR